MKSDWNLNRWRCRRNRVASKSCCRSRGVSHGVYKDGQDDDENEDIETVDHNKESETVEYEDSRNTIPAICL
jgi:hypothetical protein